jgi:Protein of unknown function (DUF3096)
MTCLKRQAKNTIDSPEKYTKEPIYALLLFQYCYLISRTASIAIWHSKGEKGRPSMTLTTIHQPVLSLIAGILILIMPKLLNYIVAIYLIIAGLLGLLR